MQRRPCEVPRSPSRRHTWPRCPPPVPAVLAAPAQPHAAAAGSFPPCPRCALRLEILLSSPPPFCLANPFFRPQLSFKCVSLGDITGRTPPLEICPFSISYDLNVSFRTWWQVVLSLRFIHLLIQHVCRAPVCLAGAGPRVTVAVSPSQTPSRPLQGFLSRGGEGTGFGGIISGQT